MSSTAVNLDINLEQIIDQVLTKKSQNNDRDYSHFHPSEFGQCHRKLVYKYYEAKGICSASEPSASLIDPQLQRIFDNGHALHARLGQNLEATGLLRGVWECKKCHKTFGKKEKLGIRKPPKCNECECIKFHYHEVGFYDEETMLGGHVDAILDFRGHEDEIPEDASEVDSQMVVDFKSIRSEAFRRLSAPRDTHVTQMQVYLYLSGLKFGKFLYENKNDQSFREFLILRDDSFVDNLVVKAKELKNIVLNTNSQGKWTLPIRAHKKNNAKECVECPFRSHCWELKK